MKNLLETSSTSSYDFKLFRKLGLEKFEFCDQEEHFLGEHIFDEKEDTGVKIYVTCMPAQFWRLKSEIQVGIRLIFPQVRDIYLIFGS